MYEAKFGLSGNPFNLNPDPSFYFGSRGHAHALAYLKFGAFQGEGFIVVTGEIGAGKTTLVRTLLEGLDPDKVVAAQIVSTQLEAGDLLRSVATSFGVAPKGLSKAELIATIEAFLTTLVTQNRRALLIVDEAQNLDREAVEELRMLSNFQLGSHALLQSFLVGQPELRTLLATKKMEQFRQRVIASCHLGPMDAGETRAYVLHRLHHVGWKDQPAFDDAAFDAIHRWSGGIPRRINILSNRLLLAAYLASSDRIDATAVEQAAKEIRAEVGESLVADLSTVAVETPAATAPSTQGRGPAPVFAAGSTSDRRRPLVCVAGSRHEDVKTIALLKAILTQGSLPPSYFARVDTEHILTLDSDLLALCGAEDASLLLQASGSTAAARFVDSMGQLLPIVQREQPSAIIVAGSSDAALAASLLAAKAGCRLVYVCGADGAPADAMNGRLIARLADVIYTAEAPTREALRLDGIPEGRVHFVGSLLADALEMALPHRQASSETLNRLGLDAEALLRKKGFGLVSIQSPSHFEDGAELADLLTLLQAISREVPLVWPVSPNVSAAVDRFGLRDLVRDSWLSIAPPLPYLDHVGLLRDARLAITDSPAALEEANVLSIPCLSVGMADSRSVRSTGVVRLDLGPAGSRIDRSAWAPVLTLQPQAKRPMLWDGRSAERIVDHLSSVLGSLGEPSTASLQAISA